MNFADDAGRRQAGHAVALRDVLPWLRQTRGVWRDIARSVPYRPPAFLKSIGVGVALAAAGFLLRLALSPLVGSAIPVVLFYPFVMIASVWGGTVAGLLVMVLCGAGAEQLWLLPGGRITTLIAFSAACLSVIVMARLFRALVEIHVEDEERAKLLAHEMAHRVGNLFGIVQAISTQTARHSTSIADHQAKFGARLTALARTQRLLADQAAGGADLKSFIGEVVMPFGANRFTLDGPAVAVPPYLGTSCALLLHELCTNAVKYGALSGADGVVKIDWQIEAGRVRLQWQEDGGPAVIAPNRRGFGTRLLQTAFPPAQGSAALNFLPGGVRCDIEFALA